MKRVFLWIFLLLLVPISVASSAEFQDNPAAPPAKKLVIGLFQDPPYTFKNEPGKWTGINVDFWVYIARELKVDFTLKEMAFSEILKSLEKGTIDLAIANIAITGEREKRIDFTTPFGSTRLAMATLRDAGRHPWWEAIRIFFSWGTMEVLGILLSVLFLVGFIFWLVERKNNPDHFGGGIFRGIGAGIYWVGSTLASGVCFGIALKSLPARMLGILWMFVCALALSAFTASLASSLIGRHLADHTLSRENLRGMHLGAVKDEVSEFVVKKIGGRYTLYKEEEEALKALLDKKVEGFLYDEVTLHYYAENDYRDKISIQPTNMKRIPCAFGLPPGSPLRKPINMAMLNIIEEPLWESILGQYGLMENLESQKGLSKQKKNKRIRY